MIQEKDIKEFLRSNAPVPGDKDGFMTDLKRQIDLLPVPASLREQDRESVLAETELVMKIGRMLKKENLRRAYCMAALSMAVMAVLVLVSYRIPEPEGIFMTYRYYIMGAAVLCALAVFAFRIMRYGIR